MSYLSNYLWIHKDEVNTEVLRGLLTKTPEVYRGKGEPVKLFVESEKYVGVPRIWGLNEYRVKWDDRTTRPRHEWPLLSPGFKYRKGQKEAVDWAVKNFNGGSFGCIINARTGSGKTLCSLVIASQLNTPAIVCVHKDDLVNQWVETFNKFFTGKVGIVKRDKLEYEGCDLVVASTQTLVSRIDKLPKEFVRYFGLAIFDEAHLFPARTFSQVLNLFPARHRLGVTATLRRRDGFDFMWTWAIGSAEFVMEAELHPTEYCQTVLSAGFSDNECFKWGKMDHTKYLECVTNDRQYNLWVVDQIVAAVNAGRKPIVLSDRIDHLQRLANTFSKKSDASYGLYVGSIDGKTVKKAELDRAAASQVVFSTYQKGGIGTDIPELDTAILAGPKKDVEQAIGRIRRPLDGKKIALIIDPVLETPYSRGLGYARLRQYKNLDIPRQ